jgi:hypothetical protein
MLNLMSINFKGKVLMRTELFVAKKDKKKGDAFWLGVTIKTQISEWKNVWVRDKMWWKKVEARTNIDRKVFTFNHHTCTHI